MENLSRRPPAGLDTAEWVANGSQIATERVTKVSPNLVKRPPAGLSTLEWAKLGLEAAKRTIRRAVGG